MSSARPYPFDQLPRLTRAEARAHSALAAWLAARPSRDKLAALAGGPVRVRIASGGGAFDPFAARCEVRIAGASIEALGSSRAIRSLAQRLLGGPAEVDAPRPLTHVEQSLWALVVATAVEDLAIAGEVIPRIEAAADVRRPARAVRPRTRVRRPQLRTRVRRAMVHARAS